MTSLLGWLRLVRWKGDSGEVAVAWPTKVAAGGLGASSAPLQSLGGETRADNGNSVRPFFRV
ncbi:MAG TPA: hypothetical protein VEQ37_11965, partial [Actinomycetota bacterium]|nr:hypothetical protein [Actinomycetota bacterium]